MAIFEIEKDGKIYEVEAPDQAQALAGFQSFTGPQEPEPVEGATGVDPLPGPQRSNIAIKGDMAPGDRIQPDMNAAFVQGLTMGFGDEVLTPVATGIRQGINAATGEGPTGFGDVHDQISARHDAGLAAAREQHGGIATGVEIAGALTSAPALPALRLFGRGNKAVSAGQKLLQRTGNAAATGGAYSGLYGAGTAEGGIGERAVAGLKQAPFGMLFGGAVPVLGAGLRAGKDALGRRIQAATRPQEAAETLVGQAAVRDQATGNVLSQADDAAAAGNAQPIINVDRGGETTGALARKAANTSPEARSAFDSIATDRFTTQNIRAQSIVNRVAGGAVDDIGYQESLRLSAQRSNKPAYDKAYNSPKAQAMWDDDFAQLLQAPAMQQAVRESTTRGANRAAVDGFKAVKNPFTESADGVFTLKTNKDGSQALPNLPFWDQVKRNLDSTIGTLRRAGDDAQAADITSLKNGLVDLLDTAVPEFATARQGAARFFNAEDALEAGRNFVRQNKDIRGSVAAIKKMTDPEREAFRTGFAAELMEQISKTNDRTNVVRQIFGSQASRTKIEAALGKGAARELETFAKIETTMDQLRTVLGNSTTARQLVELGLGGGIGGATGLVQSGDPATAALYAVIGAGAGRGFTKAREAVSNKVMKEVADILISADPAKMQAAVRQVTSSQVRQRALDEIMDRVGAIGGGAGFSQLASP